MKLSTIFSILAIILIFSCKHKQTDKVIYYKIPNGKIITTKVYDSLEESVSQYLKYEKTIVSTIEKGDSIIKTIEMKVIPLGAVDKDFNPYENAEKFIGKKLPFNSITTINDELLNIRSLNGKPTLINFWFTNCIPCIKEMPELNKIKEDYGDTVNFIAITFETKEKVTEFLKKKDFNFIQIVNSKKEIDKIENEAYPMNMFLDKDGIIKFVRGNLTEKDGKDFRVLIDKLL
ncbi:MAG: TlpA disulfide reductase family protein [Psychroserpens sp.]|uniref:TlpA family protein disulfide reductase n=1 Tax=Psychroserpens sp. TaxID=2020870 RepID=UPI003C78BA08